MSDPILKVDNLSKRYGDLQALSGVSFEVLPGQIVGLLGHNGAGKSTLIKCLMGSIRSYTGTITLDGRNIRKRHRAIRDNAGFLLEPAFSDHLTARANLELLNSLTPGHDKARVQEVLELVSLKKFADKKVSGFSFGMRQRLGLAQVLLSKPRLIVLDEPTVGLDPLGVEIIKDIILRCSEQGIAVLFSSHQLSDVLGICHRTVVMKEGLVVHDGPASELNRKTYSIQLGRDAGVYSEVLEMLCPGLKVMGRTVRLTDSRCLNTVMDFLVRRGLTVVDIDCDTDMERLKALMQR